MGLGNRKIKDLDGERFADVLADAQRSVHKSQKVFYVDSNTGNSAYNGRRINSPFATLAQAYAACTASQGDQIFVLPNHAETVTAVLTMSKADVAIKGFKLGNKYPTITINGAVDMFSMEAAGQEISGIGATIATTDAATAIVNLAAAKCLVKDMHIIPSATSVNVVDVFTVASGADDCVIQDTKIYNTTVAVNSFLSIEAAVARLQVKGNRWYGDVATAGVIDGATATFLVLEDNVIATIGTTIPAVTLDNNPAPVVAIRNSFLGTHTTIATNANLGNLARLTGNFVLEATDGSVSATPIIPAYDTE